MTPITPTSLLLTAPVASLRVTAPAQPLQPLVATAAVTALLATGRPLSLDLLATADRVELLVTSAPAHLEEVERALRGVAPDWELRRGAPTALAAAPRRLACCFAERPDWAPLRDVAECAGVDPLGALLEAVQPLEVGESLLIRYVLQPVPAERRALARRGLTVPAAAADVFDLLARLLGAGSRVPRFEPRQQRLLEARLDTPAATVVGVAALAGARPERLRSRAHSLGGVFASHFAVGFDGLALGPWAWLPGPGSTNGRSVVRHPVRTLYLTVGELAALWHVPSNTVAAPGVAFARRAWPIPRPLLAPSGIALGVAADRGGDRPLRVSADDFASHCAIFGRTGVGKSTALVALLAQLAARPDSGLVVLDPHGSLARDLAAQLPGHRREDTALLELGDADFPVGLNPFARHPGVAEEDLVQSAFAILRLIFAQTWSTSRMEDAIFSCVATLCRQPRATLADVPTLVRDPGFRRKCLARVSDPSALEFWEDFEALPAAQQRELYLPILRRIRSFYRSPAVRNIVCQERSLDFADALARGQILLIDLAGGRIGAEADLLAELIIAKLHLAAMGRLEHPERPYPPCYLAIDEAQRFSGASLPILFREARKARLALFLATQYLGALGEELAKSVTGNVGQLLVFRSGPEDARSLGRGLGVAAEDLQALDRFQAVARLQVGGETLPPVLLRTRPPERPEDPAWLARLRERSRAAYARPRAAVEATFAREQPWASAPGGPAAVEDLDEE